jgi:hypothetical protein
MILRERTESLNLTANDCTTSKATVQTKYDVCKNELTISKKAQCPKTTAKTNSHEIYLRKCYSDLSESNQNLISCLTEKPKLIKADETTGSRSNLPILIAIIVHQAVFILIIVLQLFRALFKVCF